MSEVRDARGLTNEDYITASKYCHELFTNEATLEKAWAMYSHRERYYWGPDGRAGLKTPVWKGERLEGKTLLLCYEQAIGESLLFSTMIPDLLKTGVKLVVEVDKRLVGLLGRSFPTVTFVPFTFPWDNRVYSADFYTLFGSIGYYLRKTKRDFGEPTPYLVPKPLKLPSNGLPVVGLSWYSPMKYAEKGKSIDYNELNPIINQHNKSLFAVNLQYGIPHPNDIYSVPDVDLVKDIDTIASIVNQCDAVVTISNTVAHIAGALGKKTYLLLQKSPARLWYWSWDWYKSINIIELDGEEDSWTNKITKISNLITNKA